MDVKQAVSRAKAFAEELLAGEGVTNLGLEEVEYLESEHAWDITVGFSRPWNTSRNPLTALTGDVAAKRTYRVVRVRDDDGSMVFLKRRESVE